MGSDTRPNNPAGPRRKRSTRGRAGAREVSIDVPDAPDDEQTELSSDNTPGLHRTASSNARLSRAAPHFSRFASDDSSLGIRRTDSLLSLEALARIIDSRSGYYEECRVGPEQLRSIRSSDVRSFYQSQNEVLDGWREVDEILESQFPMEVMRRFADPVALLSQHKAQDWPVAASQRQWDEGEPSHSIRIPDEEEGYGSDEDSDSIFTHPFGHRAQRRQRRISERALNSLSGFWLSLERTRSMGAVRGEESPERSRSRTRFPLSSSMNSQLPDLEERSEAAESGVSSSSGAPCRDSAAGTATPPKKAASYGTMVVKDSDTKPTQVASPAMPPTGGESSQSKRNDTVWTKADRERSSLLQNVPTHQRRIQSDEFVRWYIASTYNRPEATLTSAVNLLINLLLTAGKVMAVLSSNSVSLLASLVDSALDLLSTVVIFATSRASAYRSWNTFYKYPVGKRRLEPLGVLIFSVLMVMSFAQVLLESVNRLWGTLKYHHGDNTQLPMIGIVLMLVTIVVKSFMWLWCRNSKNSSAAAIAQDSENDVMFNIFSLIFPLLDAYFKLGILDPIGGGLLSTYIIIEWVSTLADTTSKLTGKVAGATDVSRCLYLVSRFELVQSIAGFELYHAGDNMVAEVDVVLPMSFHLKEAHDLGEIITYCIESITGIERAYIHLDYNPTGQSGHIGQRG